MSGIVEQSGAVDDEHLDRRRLVVAEIEHRRLLRWGAPIEYDMDEVFAAAARTGTALEINAYPGPARPAGRARDVGEAPRREVLDRHRLALDRAPRPTCATASGRRSADG